MSASTATDNQLQLVTCPHPLTMERQRMALPVGGTLREMLAAGGIYTPYAHVFVDDELVPFERWELVRPAAGSIVTARVVPSGGGGGKNPLRMVLQIAVLAAAVAVPGMAMFAGAAAAWGGVGGALMTAGIGLVGSLAINALIPPPMPNVSGGGGLSLDRGHAITGSRNRAVPFGTVPCVLGTNRLYPLMAAMPYTETLGDKQFYRMLFCAGYAPLTTSAFKIGETDLAGFDGVEIEEGVSDVNPPSLFSNDVYEESVSVKLPTYDYSGGSADHSAIAWTQRTTQANVDEISLDLGTFSGLFYMTKKGKRQQVDIDIQIQTSPAGAGTWADVIPAEITGPAAALGGGVIRLTAKEAKVFWVGLRWGVVGGQYDIRMRRVAITVAGGSPWNDEDQNSLFDDVHWASLRSITQVQPVAMPGVHLIALRIQATDQLEGIVDRFNLVAQAHVPIYDGTSWSTAASNSPAWAYAAVLTGPANKRPLPLARLDAAALKGWADDCTSAGFTFNAVIDGRTTVLEMLNNITAVGRAARAMNDGLHSVVQDVAQTVPVQLFSPRNSWGFSGTKVFAEQAHALKTKFVRAVNGYQQDEITVYDDGYDAGSATRFETIELYGVDNADQAWKLARYHIAVARLRPESYELSVDVEHIVCTRGDLVRVAHDVPKWGSGWGRIKVINGLDITLDEQVLIEAGESYVVRIRTADGTVLDEGVSAAAGETDTLTLAGALAGIAVGDLVLFGLLGSESVELIVKAIEPGPDLTARLRLVDAAPAVLLADQGTIPAYSSNMTGLADPSLWIPPVPNIVSISSTLRAPQPGIEGLTAVLTVCYTAPAGGKIAPSWVEVQVRLSGSDSWATVPAVPAAIGEIEVGGVIPDEAYDVRVRALSHYRTPSDFSAISLYTPDGSAQDAYLESVANLRVLEGAGTTFEGRDCNLVWDGFSVMFAPPVWFKHYKIEIRDLDNTLRRTETVLEPRYTYTYGANYDDGAGAVVPSFKVLLQVVDVEDVGTVPIEITVANTTPAAASALLAVGEMFAVRLSLSYTRPADFDYLEVWAATEINDRSVATLVGSCVTDEFLHSGLAAVTSLYYWVRVVDLYGQSGGWYPASPTGGVNGSTSSDASALLAQLTGQLLDTQLHADLIDRIDAFPGGVVGPFDTATVYAIGDFFTSGGNIYKVIGLQGQPNATPPNATYYSDESADAAASAAAALASENAALSSANSAATQATNAAGSASSASGSATAAGTSATNASSSETNAAGSASSAATQATNAAGSATAAAGSASSAGTSATNASNSESNAAGSASGASTSEANAANSASAASLSEGNASSSAGSAATAATNAAGSASSASTSATNAASSASAANGSASAALTSKNAAATSETNAAGSASGASTSETNAATSATNAGGSATAANTSATNAATSATDAGGSATSASSSANTATTKAGEASSSATAASLSEANASNSEAAAGASAAIVADFEASYHPWFYDAFGFGNGDATTEETMLSKYREIFASGARLDTLSTAGMVGGKELRVGDNSGNDALWLEAMTASLDIAGLDTSTTIKSEMRCRKTSSADTGTIYLGLRVYDKSGAVLGNRYPVNNQAITTSYTTYWGTYTVGTILSSYPTAATVRPMMIFNYPNNAQITMVDWVRFSAKGADAQASLEVVSRVTASRDGTAAAQYTLKTDVNGNVAGFGLSNDGTASTFEILADTFAVVNPSAPTGAGVVPFVVSGGAVIMDAVFVENASITKLKVAGSAYLNGKQLNAAASGTVTSFDYATKTITHGLGRVPVVVVWSDSGHKIIDVNSTNFQVQGSSAGTVTIDYAYI